MGSKTWGRRPRQAIAGPKVMLINSRINGGAIRTPGSLVVTPAGQR
jgi:hypothetical protein